MRLFEKTIKDMIGMTFSSVTASDGELIFKTENGEKFKFYHEQDCCESVYIESIDGDLEDLEGSPIRMAEETTNSNYSKAKEVLGYEPESYTWTFYKFATEKGYVTVRWLGTSNGYYSESVNLFYDAPVSTTYVCDLCGMPCEITRDLWQGNKIIKLQCEHEAVWPKPRIGKPIPIEEWQK